MLIRFTVENYLSCRDRLTLDLSAAKTCKENIEDNTMEISGQRLLKSAIIYGANASGKSNVFRAIGRMASLVAGSSKETQAQEKIPVMPFLLNRTSAEKPTFFEVEFIVEGQRFRYGFLIDKVQVLKEWLFTTGSGRRKERALFLRAHDKDEDTIQINKGWEKASGLEERTRKNALFLSVCAQFAVEKAETILRWFIDVLKVTETENLMESLEITINMLDRPAEAALIINFIRDIDLSIPSIRVKKRIVPRLNAPPVFQRLSFPHDSVSSLEFLTQHALYDDEHNIVDKTELSLLKQESQGTQKLVALSGPIVFALKHGKVLVIDELDSQLHPIMVQKIVRAFNSRKLNPRHAQLIINTHDVNLLSTKVYDAEKDSEKLLLRRDQVYFTEKDQGEGTQLYSLLDYKLEGSRKVRNDASYEKDYLAGKYGAIPFIGELKVSE